MLEKESSFLISPRVANRWFSGAWMLFWSAVLAGLIGSGTARLPIPEATPARVAYPQSTAPLAYRPIDQIQVGDRVLAKNPTGERDDSLGEVDPATWRKITLRAHKRDGTHADVVLLRPKTWLQERNAHTGGTIEISVPECGIDGLAEVLKIDACPTLKKGKGRVVTGTFNHSSARLLHIWIEGQGEPIGTTANHLFWSENRREFIPAEKLEIGESLRMVAGTSRVERVAQRLLPEPVFNIEVHGEHVYHVGREGVLVHNAGNLFPCEGAWDYYIDLRRKNPNMTHEQAKELVYQQYGRPGPIQIVGGKTPRQVFEDARKEFQASGGPRDQFMKLHSLPKGTWVHHSIELQVLENFPSLFTPQELNTLSRFRGIPKEVNPKVHLSQIRREWDTFYEQMRLKQSQGIQPSREDFIQKAAQIDKALGNQFTPPVE